MTIRSDSIEYYATKIHNSPFLREIAKKAGSALGSAHTEQYYTYVRKALIDALPFSSNDNQNWRIELIDEIITKNFSNRAASLDVVASNRAASFGAGDVCFEVNLKVTGLSRQDQIERIKTAVHQALCCDVGVKSSSVQSEHTEGKAQPPLGGFFWLDANEFGQVLVKPSGSPSNLYGSMTGYSNGMVTLSFDLGISPGFFMPLDGAVLLDGWGCGYDGEWDVIELSGSAGMLYERIKIRMR